MRNSDFNKPRWINHWFPESNADHHTLSLWERFHLDPVLIGSVLVIILFGLMVLFSAANENIMMVLGQTLRFGFALLVMFIVAQIHPNRLKRWAPWLFVLALLLLIAVLGIGHRGKGAQRWLNLGLFRFQPSEFMKLVLPLMLAWYLRDKHLPPNIRTVLTSMIIVFLPMVLIIVQPDLGTGLIIAATGIGILFLSGINWRFIVLGLMLFLAAMPIAWHFLHDYQRNRVLTFLDPERDPLGAGYHIIQSKIAIGSGGIFGKGWFNGTQAHLDFLPEHSTDFIYSVLGEEFGFMGALILLPLYLLVSCRGFYIAYHAHDHFSRLLAGALSFTFFLSIFVNIGMVCGILPVVGLPLPLLSYGGTSVVTLMASFGILMSIGTRRHLIST